MDVGTYVTDKLRNHLTNYHETWHIEIFFPRESFMLFILFSLAAR